MSENKESKPVVLVMATRNAHKVGEIRSILGNDFEYRTLVDFPGAPKVVEDASTFAGNATKKAVELAGWLARNKTSTNLLGADQVFVLADDSGLEVDALGGAPGVHSARFALTGEGKDAARITGNAVDTANNAKLLRLLQSVPAEKRMARFRCVLALAPVSEQVPQRQSPVCHADETEMQTALFEGVCEGQIRFAPSGTSGFGYDPLFVPVGHHQSFAELGEQLKNSISHRARALAKLGKWFKRRVALP